MTTGTFIGTAIKGGVDDGALMGLEDSAKGRAVLCLILLNPASWESVGNVQGWWKDCDSNCSKHGIGKKMSDMVYAIANSDDEEDMFDVIDDYLKTI